MCKHTQNLFKSVTFESRKFVTMQSEDKELVSMPKMWHVLVKEPGNEKIITRIVEWVLQRT